MKIIIVGCGKIGKSMIENLTLEGHDLLVVDNDAKILNETTDTYDVMGVCGNAVDCDTLMEAGVENADVVVAVTSSDEINMLSCYLARKLGANHAVARIRNPEYNDDGLVLLPRRLQIFFSFPQQLKSNVFQDATLKWWK